MIVQNFYTSLYPHIPASRVYGPAIMGWFASAYNPLFAALFKVNPRP